MTVMRAIRLSRLPAALAVAVASATFGAADAGATVAHAASSKPKHRPLVPTGLKCNDLIVPAEVGGEFFEVGVPEPECDYAINSPLIETGKPGEAKESVPGEPGVEVAKPKTVTHGPETYEQLGKPIQLVRFIFEVNAPKRWHFHYLVPKCGHERLENPKHGPCYTFPLGDRAWLEADPQDETFECSPIPPSIEHPETTYRNCGIAAKAALQVNNAVAIIIVYGELGPGVAKARELMTRVAHTL
jgi:hypothetical protein